MIEMDPQQELFIYLRKAIKELGYAVYDGALPSENTSYPFVYLADSEVNGDFGYKGIALEDVTQTIHVWHSSPRKRGNVSNMLANIKIAATQINTDLYSFHVTSVAQRILTDETTNQPLMHGILEIGYKLEGVKKND